MKLKLGFDVTDMNVTDENFKSNMEILREFLNNRKRGLESLRYSSPTTKHDAPPTAKPAYRWNPQTGQLEKVGG